MRCRSGISALLLLLGLSVRAAGVPCATDHPQICDFLDRYIASLRAWDEPNVSVYQKMYDDKFVVLSGSIEALDAATDTTAFSLRRYDDKAYEVTWANGVDTLLCVTFPISYELIWGLSLPEIEKQMPSRIAAAPERKQRLDTVRFPEINLPSPSALDTTILRLFCGEERKNYLLQITQSLYGFKQAHYTVSLEQWLNYLAAEQMSCFAAIEEESEESLRVLVIAQNNDLAYRHVLSVWVPRKLLSGDDGILETSLTAFIPIHNIKQ